MDGQQRARRSRTRAAGLLVEVVVAACILAVLGALAVAPTDPAPRGPGVASGGAERHTPGPAATPTPTRTGPDSSGPAAISFTAPLEPNPADLAGFYGQHPSWSSCPGGECATVRVPVDYDDPDGATVQIALLKVSARDRSQRKGTLFVNPGGPGESGIDFLRHADGYFGPAVRAAWDLVGFDPRGMGASGGFDCLTDRELDAMYAADPTPDTSAERRARTAEQRHRIGGCVRRGGELALNMGTENVIRDLDILRDAVGDDRLNYLGVSYGTLIGAMYADAFTSRVGLVVLDSAMSPDGFDDPGVTQADVDAQARHDAADLDAAMDDFAAACLEHDCPLGESAERVRGAVIALLDRLDRRPIPTAVESLPRLTEGWAADAIRFGLREPKAWRDLIKGLAAARDEGDGTWLAFIAMVDVGREEDGTYPGSSFGKNHLPVSCADWPTTTADRLTPSDAVLDQFPLFARLAPGGRTECVGWPGPIRSNLLVGAEPTTPILVIGNERDPVTPIGATAYLSRMLVRSRLVTVDAGGHGAYGAGNACADRVVEEYLVKGLPPAGGTRCPAG